jgi:tetratricopeptide (TPR) repeat protein
MPTRLRLPASVLVPLLLAAALAAALVPASRAVFRAQEAERFEIRYLPTSRPLKLLSPALQLSIADHYWMQTVQYLGDNRSRHLGLPQLFPLVDLITDLDPEHGYAYQAAGLVLSSFRLEESDAILKKGMERGPNWWSYPFYLAFNDYYYRGDYASAARWAEVAARTPGARPSISRLALALKVKSGSPDDAVRFIEEMRATVTDERLREALDEQYREALLQRGFAILDEAVARYAARHGRPPARLEALVGDGLLGQLPPEPYGGAYELREGKVHSTGRDFRVPAAEPAHPLPPPPPPPVERTAP